MPKLFGVMAALAALIVLPPIMAQGLAPTQSGDKKNGKWNTDPFNGAALPGYKLPSDFDARRKSQPAPKRDLNGIWDATAWGGVQASGVAEHPASYLPGDPRQRWGQPDEKGIINPIPYTALGEKRMEANKPSGTSIRALPAVLANDPVNVCDPAGFPYIENFQFLTIELVQAKNHVLYLGEYEHTWRIIWTDGRPLPKNPEPRWNGYSVGHWEDDYTFIVETIGLNEKSWLDHAGRPHTADLKVTEIFHRVDRDIMEHTEIIEDPALYTQPWKAHDKLPLHLQSPDFDPVEMFCSPSETAAYNESLGKYGETPAGTSTTPASK
jgi:hypothetical protein